MRNKQYSNTWNTTSDFPKIMEDYFELKRWIERLFIYKTLLFYLLNT